MMPDKIYIRQYRDGDTSMFWDETPHEDEIAGIEAVEYIRKNALLEWAKERYKSTISNVGCYTGHSVWQEVIDKLNSM